MNEPMSFENRDNQKLEDLNNFKCKRLHQILSVASEEQAYEQHCPIS